jgi:DNA topoisomerase-6 subunit B
LACPGFLLKKQGMTAKKKTPAKKETAESMASRQRDISVSEFFLKNRHLLGFDSPRKSLVTAVKEAVDNSLDACEEAGILPEISVELRQTSPKRFRMTVLDNGPGIVKSQIAKIFAKLLYGSKFHRLKQSRGQQGIGISAAGMYGQLTTGGSTVVLSKIKGKKMAQLVHVQLDAKTNKPHIHKDAEEEWLPTFFPWDAENEKELKQVKSSSGTQVSIEMEATYIRGKLSVDEFLKQCAIVNPHLQLYYRVILEKDKTEDGEEEETPWLTYFRALKKLPVLPTEIKPHPHGVELGVLMQMLKDTPSRTLRGALSEDFSRVSSQTALKICETAELNPKANPRRIAHQESEALYQAIQDVKLMRPPTDCLSPIGEDGMLAGLKKEIVADFYTATTRNPTVYRGNPFQVEVALAYAKPGADEDVAGDEPVRLMRFANRVPLLYLGGACAMNKAVSCVKWKSYGLSQPKGSLPLGPMVIMVHMTSVWVPFTSESKEAIAHYQEIIKELTFALQDCGRKMSIFLNKRKRAMEQERKRNYIEMYIPHMALGMKEVMGLTDKQEDNVVGQLKGMLERSHLEN